MKVLIYSHFFAPRVGGVETFASHLASGLAEKTSVTQNGTSVTVVTQTAESVQHDPPLPFPVFRQPSAIGLWKLVLQADKILLAGPAILPLAFALLARKQVFVTHHGYQSICPNGMHFHFPSQRTCIGQFATGHYLECIRCNAPQAKLAGSLRMLVLTFLRRFLSRLADKNIAVSSHVKTRIALPGTFVIRNGVPEVSETTTASSPNPSEPACFAYVGRLVTEKGLPVLVDAAGILKERGHRFRLLIIGDGPERPALESRVLQLNLNNEVAFLGLLLARRLTEAMRAVSALVMPSICEDAAPLSVLEQMMQGKLIIGANIGGLAEEIGDAGLIFAPGNPVELADRMARVMERPEIIAALGKKARERALEAYTLQHMLWEYRQALQIS